jgi:hypothetical protein
MYASPAVVETSVVFPYLGDLSGPPTPGHGEVPDRRHGLRAITTSSGGADGWGGSVPVAVDVLDVEAGENEGGWKAGSAGLL